MKRIKEEERKLPKNLQGPLLFSNFKSLREYLMLFGSFGFIERMFCLSFVFLHRIGGSFDQ